MPPVWIMTTNSREDSIEIGQTEHGLEGHSTYADVLGLPRTKLAAKCSDRAVISVFEDDPRA